MNKVCTNQFMSTIFTNQTSESCTQNFIHKDKQYSKGNLSRGMEHG